MTTLLRVANQLWPYLVKFFNVVSWLNLTGWLITSLGHAMDWLRGAFKTLGTWCGRIWHSVFSHGKWSR